jgi:hypothetical protein
VAQSTRPASHGHNSGQPLTDEEFDDLVLYYSRVIRAEEGKAAIKKAEADAARKEVNGQFKRMSADLKYTRKDFEALLDDQEKTAAELLAQEARRSRLYRAAGMMIGAQFELPSPRTPSPSRPRPGPRARAPTSPTRTRSRPSTSPRSCTRTGWPAGRASRRRPRCAWPGPRRSSPGAPSLTPTRRRWT